MSLFDRIKETAQHQGMTLLQVTEKSGLGEKTIYKWKTQNPKTETLQKVADVLGVSVDYLLGNTDIPSPSRNKYGSSPRDQMANEVGAMFRSVADHQDLTDEQAKKLQDDFEGYLKFRAKWFKEHDEK